VFSTKFVDHGSRHSDAMRALAQWQHPVGSSDAQDVLHRAMCPTLHRHIRMMAIKIVSDSPAFFVDVVDLLFAHNVSLRPCYGQHKLKPSYFIVVIDLFICLWPLLSTMDAVWATIFTGGRAICRKHE